MGKATIKSHIADGEYSVEIQYDMRRIEQSITRLTARYLELSEERDDLISLIENCVIEPEEPDAPDVEDDFEESLNDGDNEVTGTVDG